MSTPPPSPRAADLLAGPRGRRLLLQLLTETDSPTSQAAFAAAIHLEPQAGTVGLYWSDTPPDRYPDATSPARQPTRDEIFPAVPPDVVARHIADAPLPDITAELLSTALDQSVCSAMYWQPPDGTDALCATPPVRRALEPVAAHLAASSLIDWWWSAPALADQWTVTWGEDAAPFPGMSSQERAAGLSDWRDGMLHDEQRDSTSFERRRAPENTASGAWWSSPVWAVPSSTRTWPDGSAGGDPVGALFVEDRWEDDFCATRFTPPPDARILEITGADDWAALCRESPLEVTWSHRGDWYRTTGRDSRDSGPWLIPDWSAVADKWDAVHLTVAGYLAAATRSIPVAQDAASVIAGWGPDVTYWLR